MVNLRLHERKPPTALGPEDGRYFKGGHGSVGPRTQLSAGYTEIEIFVLPPPHFYYFLSRCWPLLQLFLSFHGLAVQCVVVVTVVILKLFLVCLCVCVCVCVCVCDKNSCNSLTSPICGKARKVLTPFVRFKFLSPVHRNTRGLATK